jgi:DNA-binding transcriptional LysR family regulator
VAALEERIQTRLLNRTTRKVTLTEAGRHYAARCSQVLGDIDEMESSLLDWHQKVSGVLTVNAPMSFGHRHLPLLLIEFRKRYPDVEVKLNLTDVKVDIVEEGVDIALRIGNLKSDNIIAKRICDIHLALLASPDYLARRGTPLVPEDLSGHDFLRYTYADPASVSNLLGVNLAESGMNFVLSTNNGDLLTNTAVSGGGLTIQPTFIAGEAIREGKLVRLLCDYQQPPLGLYLIYANRQFMPSKTRAFIDFLSSYYGDKPYWDEFE